MLFGLWADIMCDRRLEGQIFAEVAFLKWFKRQVVFRRVFTSVANGYNFLQDFLFGAAGHGFHQDVVGSSRCESDQCGAVGGAGKTHL